MTPTVLYLLLGCVIIMSEFKALYIIHIGKDLGVLEFNCDAENWHEFEETAKFHFEERLESIEEFALFYKKDYFKEDSKDTWDVIDLVEVNAS